MTNNKETLILLTASCRYDNLMYLAKTIEPQYKKYIDKFDIRWLICKDQYNGTGNIKKVIKFIDKTNINYKIYDSGLPNHKNFGGSIYNEPLQKYVQEEQLDNPWVHFLDDDNILHPRTLEIFNTCLENDFYGNKEIITTINKWHCGHNREIDEYSFLQADKSGFIREWFMFDPSSVMLRYNIIEKYGFILDDFLYDFHWLNMPVIQNETENTIWYNYYDGSYGRHLIGTYHNGLVKSENLNPFVNIESMNMDIILYDSNIELPQMIPILSKETKEKIFKLIQRDIKKFETIKI